MHLTQLRIHTLSLLAFGLILLTAFKPSTFELGIGTTNGMDNANRAKRADLVLCGWEIKASMSVARSRPAAAAVNDRVYVIGGEGSAGSYERTTEEYNPADNTWATKALKPTGVSNIGAGVINDKIYVPGGYKGFAVSVVEVYDPALESWSTVAPLPTAQFAQAVAVVNDKLYVVGGNNGSNYTSSCYVYDPSGNSWSSCASMTYARGYAGAGVVNGKIYVVGGMASSTNDLDYVEEFDPVANTWQTVEPLGTARSGPGVVGFGNYLYVCGGGWSSPLASCVRYAPGTNTWASFSSMNIGRRTFGLVETNGKLYAEAGYKEGYSADNEENALTTCNLIHLPIVIR
jgi:N-acetylneuraminic acid mutarotase